MDATIDEDDRLAMQIERLQDAWSGFRVHLGVYVAVNLVLAFTDLYLQGGGAEWFYWPLSGWGAGLLVHYSGLRRHERRLRDRAKRLGVPYNRFAGS